MYDLIIIGGGINGCGIARDAAMRGFKVLLIEKEDFAAATSSKNSQMIHGGLRYLLSDIHTTKISCQDSGFIQKIASFLLFRIPFLCPFLQEPYQSAFSAKLKLEEMETLLEVYDRYAPLKNAKPHTRLTREQALQLEPDLSEKTIGAVTFDEWGIDSPRLTFLNAFSAHEHGAELRNHTEVVKILKEQNRVVGLQIKDLITGVLSEVRGRLIFNAAGPWVPKIAKMAGVDVKLRPAKGIHITFDRKITNMSILADTLDGRSVFLMPHQNVSILGTTDDDYFGDPDNIPILEDEVEYLIEAVARVFPKIRQARMSYAWAAIRPTLYERPKYEDDLTREHEIFDHETRDGVAGFLSIAGGKLAAYRLMSEEAVDVIGKKLGHQVACRTHLEPLPGAEEVVNVEELAQKFKIPLYAAHRLVYRRGSRAVDVLKLLNTHPAEKNIICDCDPILEAELRYAVRHEWARTLEDLARRTRFSLGPCQGTACLMPGAQILGEELGLSASQVFEITRQSLEKKWEAKRPILKGTALQQEELFQAVHFNVGCLDGN